MADHPLRQTDRCRGPGRRSTAPRSTSRPHRSGRRSSERSTPRPAWAIRPTVVFSAGAGEQQAAVAVGLDELEVGAQPSLDLFTGVIALAADG
ncbi:MAG: hypothetical protein R2710_12680 [Acidimicrobiales bacterium]